MWFAIKIIAAILLVSGLVFAHSVTMNFAFRIGTDKNNTIHVNDTDYLGTGTNRTTFTGLDKKYISSNTTNVVAGIVFAGSRFLDAHINTTYSSDAYLMQMRQGSDAKFLLTFTNGTWQNIDDKARVAEDNYIIPKTFGALSYAVRGQFLYFIRLGYGNIDLSTRARWGSGAMNILIRNRGRDGRGISNLTIEVRD